VSEGAQRTPPVVVALLVGVQLAFASLAIVGKVVGAVVPWSALMLLRIAGALAVFTLWGAARREPLLPPAGLRGRALLLGFLGVFANQSLFLAGLRRTTAVNATVLCATIPLFTTAFSALTGREPLRARLVAGMAVAFAGLCLVIRPERAHFGDASLLGDAMIVVNCAVYGVYLALARDLVVAHGGIAVVRWAFLGGLVFALPVGAADSAAALSALTPRVGASLAYVLLVPTAFAYGANAWCLGRVPASVVSVFIYLQPVVAAGLAVTVGPRLAAWLGVVATTEALTLRTALGGLTVLLGVAVATLTTARGRAARR
jgi:drug/metabolite transporter (DMT)-like permease